MGARWRSDWREMDHLWFPGTARCFSEQKSPMLPASHFKAARWSFSEVRLCLKKAPSSTVSQAGGLSMAPAVLWLSKSTGVYAAPWLLAQFRAVALGALLSWGLRSERLTCCRVPWLSNGDWPSRDWVHNEDSQVRKRARLPKHICQVEP